LVNVEEYLCTAKVGHESPVLLSALKLDLHEKLFLWLA
jgi:hypothetical protein